MGDIRQIKYHIQMAVKRLLLLVSTIAYAAMAVASLGVTNTIMASIRSRRWQFGILRSIGVTRNQLLRLVIAEAMLLGIVGVCLGLLAGAEMSINASQEWKIIVGYNPPLVVPWKTVGFGVSVVMIISILASLWPALHVARSEPLALLQAGRAAA
jgi:putative ABC transport system permease protein